MLKYAKRGIQAISFDDFFYPGTKEGRLLNLNICFAQTLHLKGPNYP